MAKRTKKRVGNQKKSERESLLEKYKKLALDQLYPELLDELSDEDVKERIYAKQHIPINRTVSSAKVRKITTDGAFDGGKTMEFNGPIPLGYREIAPSSLPFKGPIGRALKHFGARNFYLGDQVNAWFAQNCFVNKACAMPGEDAVFSGYDFNPLGKKDKKLVEDLKLVMNSESFNLDQTMREFDYNKRCFGAAIMVPCFKEDIDMSVPFADYDQLKGKTFLGWTNIEPYYLSPDFDEGCRELNDPTYKFYMVPTHWVVYGNVDGQSSGMTSKRIHRSWIFFRRNVFTSKIYQPMYKWQGPSVPQMILERLYSAEVCANESSMLLRSKRSFVMEADVRKMAANPEYARKFLKNCAGNSDNWGVRVVPRNSNAKQMDSYLSECMPLTTAQYGILCAEVSIPAPKFMMAQLTGFANSGNYEVKLYAQKEKNLQNEELVPIVKQTLRILTACDKKKQEFDVQFNDVDVPTVTEKAEIMYEEARALKFIEEAKAFKRGDKGPGSHHGKGEVEN